MAIENEIVRFVAEIDLDPQDTAKFERSLKDCEEVASGLRREISDVGNQMAKLRAENKAGTKEYERLASSQRGLTSRLMETTKEIDSYTSALGINSCELLSFFVILGYDSNHHKTKKPLRRVAVSHQFACVIKTKL